MVGSPYLLAPYAKALFDLGKEEDCLSTFRRDLKVVEGFLKTHPSMLRQLSNPFLSRSQRLKSFKPLFETLSPLVVNFIKLLTQNKRLPLLPQIIKYFEKLYRQEARLLVAEVSSATSLSALEEKILKEKLACLADRSPSQIELSIKVDPKLLAGVQIYMPPYFVDTSLRMYLNQFDILAKNPLSP